MRISYASLLRRRRRPRGWDMLILVRQAINAVAVNVSTNVSKNVSKHLMTNATRHRVPHLTSTSKGLIGFHNETFGILGLRHGIMHINQDVEAPSSTWIAMGVVIAAVMCTCLACCVSSWSKNVDAPVRYEGIPLITIRRRGW